MKTCEYVMEWDRPSKAPKRFCGTIAKWRYEALGGGHMYLCDEHGVVHMNYAEPAPPGGWDSPQPAKPSEPA